MSYVQGLKCRECGQEYPKAPIYVCEYCFGPLEVVFDYDRIRGRISREAIAQRPKGMWRYRELLPIDGDSVVDLGTGSTPLIRADRLAKEIGLKELYIKNDATNPTYSFKDRVVSVAVSKAAEFGFGTVACASTGNLAGSVAAHAARAGLASYIFIPASLEPSKIFGTLVYGPQLVAVEGHYDDVNRLSSEIADKFGWAFVNINLRPYYSEGSKTLAFEVLEELDWQAPDHVIAPAAGGSLVAKLGKAFEEAVKVGLVKEAPTKISVAQAEGCGPIVTALKEGSDTVRPVKPNTIARSLAIGNPADGFYAAEVVRNTGGYGEHVTDEEIVEAIHLLARTEGIFTETAGGVTLGALKKLVASGRIDPSERTVLYITGNGYKTMEAIESTLPTPVHIGATIQEFEKAFPQARRESA